MVLSTPKNESCSNCYFCASYEWSKTEVVNMGFFKSETLMKTMETFVCRYNPPYSGVDATGYASHHIMPSMNTTIVKNDHWCGKWKKRDE